MDRSGGKGKKSAAKPVVFTQTMPGDGKTGLKSFKNNLPSSARNGVRQNANKYPNIHVSKSILKGEPSPHGHQISSSSLPQNAPASTGKHAYPRRAVCGWS